MDQSHLFRKVSIERLQSPEQLDQLVTVVSTRAWIALVTLCALLAIAIAWSIVGTLPTKVNAQGILIHTGGVFSISAAGSGPVSEVLVKEGDTVSVNQIVARIDQPELERQAAAIRSELAELRAEHQKITSYLDQDTTVRSDSQVQRRQQLEAQITFTTQQIQALRDQLATQESLLERGLVTRQAVLQARTNLFNAQDQLEASKGDLQQLSVGELSMRGDHAREVARSQFAINDAERRLNIVLAQHDLAANVRSPYDGRIVELKVRPGDILVQGGTIASLQRHASAGGLEALLYVSPSDGKSIQPGMELQISPSSAPRQEFGFIRGSVTYVSYFPSTPEAMSRVLGNTRLAEGLASSGAPFAVYGAMAPGPGASGVAWSSPKGESIVLSSGTPCTATITIRNRHPIELVIPLLREYTGL